MGTAGVNSVLTAVRSDTGYDTLRAFAPILQVASLPTMLGVHPSAPANSIAELVPCCAAHQTA
jgi:tripartite-type tricarboxylate transporter receptor subunit TctC